MPDREETEFEKWKRAVREHTAKVPSGGLAEHARTCTFCQKNVVVLKLKGK